ncbi:MAG TPA: TonB-dependent receptor, partial [Verrucomicrobiae bacterium]
NAVNGVINIITKSARDTQGTYISGGGGSWLQDFGAVRYGGSVSSNLFYRVYGQHSDRDSSLLANGNDATNAWDMTQGGFRMDYYPSDVNTLTLQGDAYAGGEEQPAPGDVTLDGQNVLGRWTRTFSEESDLSVQAYFDRTWRDIPGTFAEDLKTYDLDFQNRFPLGGRQSITWGAGYRLMVDEVQNSAALAFLPANKDMQLFGGFVQDEIALVPDRLKFTLGTKLEHNDFSGFEVQPSVRLAWTPDERQTVWAAVSRAVRSPSRIDTDLFVPGSPPYLLAGGTNFDSEKLIAYELGYRVQPQEKLSLSLASYYNFYNELRSLNMNSPGHFVLANDFRGEVWGAELSANYQSTTWWRLRAGYDYLHKNLWPTSANATPSVREGNDPQNQCSLQSIMDLPAHFQVDFTARYVDTLPTPNVPSYITFDARLAWQYKRVEIALVGQNLASDRHAEFRSSATAPAQEIPRSVYGKITVRF